MITELLNWLPELRGAAIVNLKDRPSEVDDVMGELYLSMWENRERLAKMPLPEQKAYAARSIYNKCTDVYRRDKRKRTAELTDSVDYSYHHLDTIHTVEAIERAIKDMYNQEGVDSLIMQIQGYDYHEIAESQNIPVGTMAPRLARAKARLSKRLKHYL